MPVHSDYQKELKAAKGLKGLSKIPSYRVREFQNAGHKAAAAAIKVGRTEKRIIELDDWNLQLQVFYPDGETKEKLPVIMYYHGGGFIFGQFNSIIGKQLCVSTGAITVFTDYRLSPDYKFPDPLEDCYCAAKYIYDNIDEFGGDKSRFFIAGDSAGGSLAAGVAQLSAKRKEFPVHKQILIYPMCDHSETAKKSPYGSYRTCGKDYFLGEDFIHSAENAYIRSKDDLKNPLIFPLQAADFSVFPPTIVIVSEYDPLRDEGLALSEKITAAGTYCESYVGEGMLHAFMERVTMPEVLALYGKIRGFIEK